jgi:hypothetical protein
MKLYVHTDGRLESEHRGTGDQASWSEQWSFSVDRVSLSKPTGYNNDEFEIDADIKVGDTVHLLILRWSDGDSYGSSRGHGEVLWVFKDPLLAQEALKRWEYANDFHGDWRHDNKQQFASFRVDGGGIKQLNNPSFSYFASVESLRLETMLVQF